MILVTGATGFVGRYVVRALLSSGMPVRCLGHSRRAEGLFGEGVEVFYGDVTDLPALKVVMDGVDTVVHLVAIIRERGGATFYRVNHLGTRNVVLAAREKGVRHIVHISAIGARKNPHYPYLYTKWLGEQEVIHSGIPYTILRPSIQFGEGDEFINTLAGMVKALPIVPIPGSGLNRFQPIAVEDVALCVARCIGNEGLLGRVVEIGGPEHLTYNQLIDTIAGTYGVRRIKVHIPVPLMRLIVRAMEVLPRPPVTSQQLRMLPIDNITGLDNVERLFGFRPRPLAGNIDYIKRIGYWDALRITLGFIPRHIRDH
jgi:NADH dehydrogenase